MENDSDSDMSETVMVRRILDYDQSPADATRALESLYLRYKDHLYRLARDCILFLDPKRKYFSDESSIHFASEDVVQEVFVHILDNLGSFIEDSDVLREMAHYIVETASRFFGEKQSLEALRRCMASQIAVETASTVGNDEVSFAELRTNATTDQPTFATCTDAMSASEALVRKALGSRDLMDKKGAPVIQA